MILKFVFEGEIHRCSKLPDNMSGLLDAIRLSFKDTLPPKFKLKYEDPDGDRVILLNDEDYQAMLEMNTGSSPGSVKIYVEAAEEGFSAKSESIQQSSSENVGLKQDPVDAKANQDPLAGINGIEQIEQTSSVIVIRPKKDENSPVQKDLPKEEEKEPVISKEEPVKSQEPEPIKSQEPLPNNASEEPVKLAEKSAESKKEEPILAKDPEVEDEDISKELAFEEMLKRAENMDSSRSLDPQLRRTIEYAALNTIKANLGLISTVIKDSLVESRPAASSASKDIVIDTISYLQFLIPHVEGISPKTIEEINRTLKLLASQVQDINAEKGQKIPEKRPFYPPEEVKNEPINPKPFNRPGFGVTLVREVHQLPAELTTNDFVVYKTICLKNTGLLTWPEGTVLQSVGPIAGQEMKIGSLEPEKEKTTVVVIDTPQKVGRFVSTWRVTFTGENGERKTIGDPIELVLQIKDAGLNKSMVVVPGTAIFYLLI